MCLSHDHATAILPSMLSPVFETVTGEAPASFTYLPGRMPREPLKAFGSLIEEKVEPEDSVMQGVPMRPIHTEDLRATGSFLEIGDVVFGKLLAQVGADHVTLGYSAHVRLFCLFR